MLYVIVDQIHDVEAICKYVCVYLGIFVWFG